MILVGIPASLVCSATALSKGTDRILSLISLILALGATVGVLAHVFM